MRTGRGRNLRRRAASSHLACEWLEDRRLLSAGGLLDAAALVAADFVGPVAGPAFASASDESTIVGRALEGQLPAVASDAGGNYVVAWIGTVSEDTSDLSGAQKQTILAQRYTAAGAPMGDLIVVHDVTSTGGQLGNVRAGMSVDGRFIIAWDYANYGIVIGSTGSPFGAQARRFDNDGEPLGKAFALAVGHTYLEDLAVGVAGDFLIAYQATYPGLLGPWRDPELYVQRFDAAGNMAGDPVLLGMGPGVLGRGSAARAAIADDGSFVVAWRDLAPRSLGLVAQMFNADGTQRSERFRVSWLAGKAGSPAIDMAADGAFVIAWDQEFAGEHRVFADRRDASGKSLGPALEVSESAEDRATRPSVAIDVQGNFYVTWGELLAPIHRPPPTAFPDPFDTDPGGPVYNPSADEVLQSSYAAAGAVGSVRGRAFDASGVALGGSFAIGSVDSSRGFNGTAVANEGELVVTLLDDYPPVSDRLYNTVTVFGDLTRHVYVERFSISRAAAVDVNGAADGIDAVVNYRPGGDAVAIAAELVIRNGGGELLAAQMAIDGALAGDVLAAVTDGTNIAASYAGGVLSLVGADSIDNYQRVLRSVTFATSAPRAVGSTVNVAFTIDGGGGQSAAATSAISIHEPGTASIVGRHIFYNNSAFDGNDPEANAGDDGAIAPDKRALLPGETATFANLTSYTRGINGIAIDVSGGHGAITADDFVFHLGTRQQPHWSFAPFSPTVTVREGAGEGGSDRITLTWPDGAIQNAWLQVEVLANGNTGLTAGDVFYFGNAVGETGDGSFGLVKAGDVLRVVNTILAQGGTGGAAEISDLYDFNRDGRLNARDMLAVVNHALAKGPQVEALSPPGSSQAASDYYGLFITTQQYSDLVVVWDWVGNLTPNNPVPLEVDAAIQLMEGEELDSLADDPAELLLPTEPRL